jgi:histidine phosphotransferase ChpT
MTRDVSDIAALLGSRICHDLISPLGAISNGVELLQLSGDTSPEIELIAESISNANARVRFFRVAFGAAGPDQRIGASEVHSILAALGQGGRLTIDWQDSGDAPRRDVKLAFLMIQCLEAAMPWGGRITASRDNDRWTVAGQAERMKINTGLWEVLSRPDADVDVGAADVQFLMAPQMIRDTGRALTLEISETAITARF